MLLGQGNSVSQVCKQIGIAGQMYYRSRRAYGGLTVNHAKRLKQLDAENARLKRALADLTVDKLIFKEVAEEKYRPLSLGGGSKEPETLFPNCVIDGETYETIQDLKWALNGHLWKIFPLELRERRRK